MHKYNYLFLDQGFLPARLINITGDIYTLQTLSLNRKEVYTDIFTELEAVAKVQSVKNSNEIEGIITTDERVNAIVNGNSAPLNHNEQEIAGYRDALALVHTGYNHLDLRESDVRRLHATMMNIAGYS